MTIDRYLYALNNPLNRYDLNGHDVCVFGGCVGPDDVAATGEDLEGGLEKAEEGVNAVGSAAGSAADDAWDWTAPGREWTSDRAQDSPSCGAIGDADGVQTTNCPPTISCGGVAEKAVSSTRFTASS